MKIQCYLDSQLQLPQLRVLEASECTDDFHEVWVEFINETIQYLAAEWPWTRDMYSGPNPYDQVNAAYEFLDYCGQCAEVDLTRTSCDLKHDVERVSGLAIAQGYFLVAASMHFMTMQPTSDCTSFHLNLVSGQEYLDCLKAMETSWMSTRAADYMSAQESQLVQV